MAKIEWKEMKLFNPDTQKHWQVEVDGNTIRTCLNHGKVKEKEEKHPDDKAIQAVMGQLRKGFLYTDPNANIGEPIIHRYVDKAYTGFMPIAARPDREDFYVTRVVGDFEDEILYHFDADGQLLAKSCLGANRLTYRAALAADGTLYFDNTHKIEHFNPEREEFIQIEDEAQIRSMFHERPENTVTYDNLRIDCSKGRGTIEIWDYQSDELLLTVKNEFTVRNVNCALSSNRLIAHTDYGVLSIYKWQF